MIPEGKKPVSRGVTLCAAILNAIAAVILLLVPRVQANAAMVVAGFLSTAGCLFGVRLLMTGKQVLLSRNERIVSAVLSAVFLIQFSVTQVISAWNQAAAGSNQLVSGLLLAVVLAAILLTAYLAVGAGFSHCSGLRGVHSDERKKYGMCLAVIAAESLLFLFSTFPGIWIKDDVNLVFNQVMNNKWDEWHTIGYQLFVKACLSLWASPYMVNVVQTVIWILLNWYILDGLADVNRKAPAIYTVMICACVTPFLYLEVMYKDTVFSMGILALAAALFNVVYRKKVGAKDLLVFGTVPLFALLCRHGGILVTLVPCAVAALFFLLKRKWALVVRMAAVCGYYLLAFVLVTGVFTKSLNAAPNPAYVKYGMPMAMVGGAVVEGVEFSEEDKAVLEKVMPVERWGECYNRYWVDSIARSWGTIGGDIHTVERLVDEEGYGMELIKLNAKLLIQHPVVYLRCFFDMNSLVWEMTQPSDAYLWPVARVAENEAIRYSAAYRITSTLSIFLDGHPVTQAIVYRGGFALFVLLFCGLAFILNGKARYLFGILPAALNSAMLMITIPAQDPRYVMPAVVCAIFYLTIVLSMNGRNKAQAEQAEIV